MQVKNTKNVTVNVSILSDDKLYVGIVDEQYSEHACCTLTRKQAEKLLESWEYYSFSRWLRL